MRITKRDLENTVTRQQAMIELQKSKISELQGKLEIYEKLTRFFETGTVAIERTADSIAHVLTALKGRN